MLKGMLGRKIGMTQIFTEDGTVIPVTVVQTGPMTVIQKKTSEKEGYECLQVGFEDISEKKVTAPLKGHFKELPLKRFLKEFRVEDSSSFELGQQLDLSIFAEGDSVAVQGTSKGRGFAGVMKRHNFHGQPASHGHRGHRGTGSIGQRTDPGRVFKGKKLPGHYGNVTVTVLGLKIVKIYSEDNVLLISGAIPGRNGGLVTVTKNNR